MIKFWHILWKFASVYWLKTLQKQGMNHKRRGLQQLWRGNYRISSVIVLDKSKTNHVVAVLFIYKLRLNKTYWICYKLFAFLLLKIEYICYIQKFSKTLDLWQSNFINICCHQRLIIFLRFEFVKIWKYIFTFIDNKYQQSWCKLSLIYCVYIYAIYTHVSLILYNWRIATELSMLLIFT